MSQNIYGNSRINATWQLKGMTFNRKWVTRLMRLNWTTVRKIRQYFPDTIQRDYPPLHPISSRFFSAGSKVDERYHCINIPEGWLFLASVLDLVSRCVG